LISELTTRNLRFGIELTPFSHFLNLTPPYPANPGREINFKTVRAGTSKGRIVQENDVTTVLADQPPVGQDGHWTELVVENAIGTTNFFWRHFRATRRKLNRRVVGLFGVIGTNMGCKLLVALRLEVAHHFVERRAGRRSRGFEPPATFGTTKTPKMIPLNPNQLSAHGEHILQAPIWMVCRASYGEGRLGNASFLGTWCSDVKWNRFGVGHF
jgi:hypothetical protein